MVGNRTPEGGSSQVPISVCLYLNRDLTKPIRILFQDCHVIWQIPELTKNYSNISIAAGILHVIWEDILRGTGDMKIAR